MYRFHNTRLQVLLAHPGGPFYKNKDNGFWTIPKGEIAADEVALDAAIREFTEETGITPRGEFFPLGSVKQKGGKIVHAWAFQGDCDSTGIHSNTFTMEWPPKSGQQQAFPEIDRAEFFALETARRKIKSGQVGLIEELEMILDRQ